MTSVFLGDSHSTSMKPVSPALEADFQSFVRRNGIAVSLDAGDHYSACVDRLIEAREAGSLE